MVTPAARRQALDILKSKGLSERAACRFAGVSRRVVNYELKQPAKDQALGAQLIEASSRYPRFGYRRIAVMTDTKVSRVRRLWSKLGLNLPKRRPRKRRCGSDIRIPGSTAPNGVWTYDFVHDQLANGGPLKMLCVLDENTRECLAIEVGKLRDERLNREWFVSRQEAKLIIEKWRHFYNNERPHSALGNRTPASVGRERRQGQAA